MISMVCKRIKSVIAIILFQFMLVLCVGCTSEIDNYYVETDTNNTVMDIQNVTENQSDVTEEDAAVPEEGVTEEDAAVSEEAATEEYLAWTDIPGYSGEPYYEVNNNCPYFRQEEITAEVFEIYSELDSLGRCGVAYANICAELLPTEERGEIGSIKPSGWHTVKYPELIEDNYLYNRCHLIAYQLAGENDNEKNLITGTRYFNVTGMMPFENSVDAYVKNTENHVLYRVTPVFEESNLVASGVLMEAYSVEDDGEGISFCVYVYNVQPGIEIDYSNGESRAIDNADDNDTSVQDTQPVALTVNYILNKNTYKIHYPNCKGVEDMSEKNKIYFTGTREEAIEAGFVPCKNCKP